MGLLYDLSTKYKTLSIVGMAKNAGKTTALNYLIEEAMDEGIRLGVTSAGRDGETQDLVTGTEKPRVYLEQDTIVSVPAQLYDLADAGLEIIKKTPYSTSIGDLLLCRVADSGYVQIAGPVAAAETRKLCEDMFHLGCQMVLIDGAIDRRSIASPETSEAVVLATGAVLSRNMKKVVEKTAHVVGLYSLPELDAPVIREGIQKDGNEDKILLIQKDGEFKPLPLKTGLGAGRFIDDAIKDTTEYVYIPGAFTSSMIGEISPGRLRQVRFLLKDPTKIFIGPTDWAMLRKRGFCAEVLRHICVAAITVNPWSPEGYSFESESLVGALREAIPEIQILDVRM